MMCELSNAKQEKKLKIVAKSITESEMYHLASGKFSAIIHASYFKWPNFNGKDNYDVFLLSSKHTLIILVLGSI